MPTAARQGSYAAKPMHSIAPKPDHRTAPTPPLQPSPLASNMPHSVSAPPSSALDKSAESALMSWKRATERYQNALKEYAERSKERGIDSYDVADAPPHIHAGLLGPQRGVPEIYTHNITMKPEQRRKKAKFADTIVTQTVPAESPLVVAPPAKRKTRQVEEVPEPIIKAEPRPSMTYLDAMAANGHSVGLPVSFDQAVLVVGGQHLSWLHRTIPQALDYQQLSKDLSRMEPTTKKPIIAPTQLPTTPGIVSTVTTKNKAKKEASEVQWVQCDK